MVIPRIGALILLLGMVGCGTTVVSDAPCPSRPELTPISVELQLQMPKDAVLIATENQLALIEYAKKLELRAGCSQ